MKLTFVQLFYINLLILIILSLLGCHKNFESDPNELFQTLSNNTYKPNSIDFYIVHRSSNEYLYRSNDDNVEFWFTVSDDSLDPVSYYQARKDSSEEFLRTNYPNNYKLIISVIERDIKLNAFLIARYNLKAINCWRDKDSTVDIDYSFKNHLELCYSENGFMSLVNDKNIIRNYNSNWVLRKF